MKDTKNEHGTALVTTLLFLMAMGVLSTALVFTVNSEMMASAAYKYSQQAFYVANSGVHQAVDWYRSSAYAPALDTYDLTNLPPQYGGNNVVLAGREGYNSNYPNEAVSGSFSGHFTESGSSTTVLANEKNSGKFSVNATLLKHRSVMFMNPNDFSSPMPGAVERWNVDSIGYWGPLARPLGIARINAVIENDGDAFFDRALWGKDLVDMGGTSFVDSFDPTKGSWNQTTNRGNMGAIGSNKAIAGAGNTYVYGDVACGPGCIPEIDQNKVSGGIFSLPEERTFPEIPDFSVGTNNVTLSNKNDPVVVWPGKYGTLDIRKSVTFMPGDYYIDKLLVSSQGKMIISGGNPTNMFIKTELDMKGQAEANDPAHPENLTIFFDAKPNEGCKTNCTPVVKWAGGTSTSASIYAPYAELQLTGGTEYSGSFIAQIVKTIGNAQIHFDQGSMNRNIWPRPFRIITWSQSIN